MLDAMRRGVANLFAKVLLGILVIAFAIWGIGDIVRRPFMQGTALATVGKTQITVDDFKQAYKEEMQAIAQRLGRPLTPEQAQAFGVPARALEHLTGTAALDLHAKDLGLTVSDDVVSSVIKSDPQFAGPGGQFSRERFDEALRERGYHSEQEYIDANRRDLLREQLTEAVAQGVTPPQFMIEAQQRFRNEARVIEHITPDFSKLVTVAEPSQDKLKGFYLENERKYMAQEERKINLLLLSRDAMMARVKVSDDEIKAAYEAAKSSYDVPEKRKVLQLVFPNKDAAEKAYTDLSKAKDFNAAAAKLGFSATDMQLASGALLTKAQMIDPKIADAAFALKKNELSKPVEGKYSVVLLRIPEIVPAQKRTLDDVKSEIHDHLASERVGQELQDLYQKIEAGRAKGTPLKDIAKELNTPFLEAAITRSGKTGDGKVVINHADAAKIAGAVFSTTPGVETETIELSDGGFAWYDVIEVVPARQRPFEEVAADVKAGYVEEERRKEIARLVTKLIDARKPGEGLEGIAKTLNAKIERTQPVKRTSPPPDSLTAALMLQAFKLPKDGVASAPTPDGGSRTIFRVADVIAAPPPTADEKTAIKAELGKQLRMDVLDQYVSALRTRYGYNVNDKLLIEALGSLSGQSSPETDSTN